MAEKQPPKIPLATENHLSVTAPLTEDKPESTAQSQKIPEKFFRLIPLGILTGVAIVWAFVGKILIEVEGRSVLIIPSSDIELQARADGKVLTVHVQPGDTVKVGAVLVTLDLPESQEQLVTKQQKLAELQGENQAVTTVQNQRTQLKRETLQRQGQSIPREIASLKRQITSNLRQIQSNQVQQQANRRQRQAYLQRVNQLNEINKLIKPKVEAFKKLSREGVIASLSGELIRAVQAEQDNRNTITTLTAQIEDTTANDLKLQAEIKSLKSQNEDLSAKIKDQDANQEELKTQNEQLNLENLKDDIQRYNAITDQQRDIANLKTKIATDKQVLSAYNGRILDIAVNPSQYISAGTRLGTIQVHKAKSEMLGLTFFKPGDADRIQVGMEMEITPDIHQRERYGGIIATVTSISQETITPEEVARLVGNKQLAQALTNNQPVIQIYTKLRRDPTTISGYQWTEGKGAPQKIPESATATARVVVEKRSLVSYVDPVWRWFTGIYHSQ